jgi:hypothetical protein
MARTKRTSEIALMLVAFLLSGCTKSGADSTEQQRAASAPFDHYETVFYAAQIAGSYVLISNNADDLGAISAKLSATNAALNLGGIRDWAALNQHEVWGYRRYRHTEENKTAAGTSEVTLDAQALAFFADPKQKSGVLRLFSPTSTTADKMNATGIVLPFKSGGSGVWETKIPLTGDPKMSEQMFAAMRWFGFGVYV